MYEINFGPLILIAAIAGAVVTLLVVFPGWWLVSWILHHIQWVP